MVVILLRGEILCNRISRLFHKWKTHVFTFIHRCYLYHLDQVMYGTIVFSEFYLFSGILWNMEQHYELHHNKFYLAAPPFQHPILSYLFYICFFHSTIFALLSAPILYERIKFSSNIFNFNFQTLMKLQQFLN